MLDKKTAMRQRPKLVTFLGQLTGRTEYTSTCVTYARYETDMRQRPKLVIFWGQLTGRMDYTSTCVTYAIYDTDMRQTPRLVTFLGQLLRHMQVATYTRVADKDRHKDKSW